MPASTSADNDLRLDSAYFVAIEMAHDTLVAGLKESSSLNVTQYRILICTFSVAPDSMQMGEIATRLRLKANVITQAVDVLEAAGLVTRMRAAQDARARLLCITHDGIGAIASVNEAIIPHLYATFPTDNPFYRKTLEAAITAGGAIEPPLSRAFSEKYPASRTLVAMELVEQTIERTLKSATGASFSECRVLQRLGEIGKPARIGDIAGQLMLPPVSVTRAADRLVRRGWVRRMTSPADRKAVYIALNDQGVREFQSLEKIIDDVAYACYWSKLDDEHRNALCKVGRVIVNNRHMRAEAELIDQLEDESSSQA